MNRITSYRLIALALSAVFALGLCELAIRVMAEPSDRAWGRLAGLELPPVRVLPPDAFESVDRSAPHKNLVVGGKKITRGDLWGLLRPDSVLIYTALENAVSVNGWWQSNNIGARSRVDTTPTPAPGVRRLLVFGDSYANSSRVDQESTWTHVLDESDAELEVVGLGVDGYGLTQSFLRYRRSRRAVQHDSVLIMFVPSADLPRDINMCRALMGWRASLVVPRFVLRDGKLELIPSPYRDREDFQRRNATGASPELRDQLRTYDRFYFASRYDQRGGLRRLATWRLASQVRASRAEKALYAGLKKSDSEAMRVSRAILTEMSEEVSSRGQAFFVVVLPTAADVARYEDEPAYRNRWDRMVEAIRPESGSCLDLMSDLRHSGELDQGYDGTHFGPRTNAVIAASIGDFIRSAPGEDD